MDDPYSTGDIEKIKELITQGPDVKNYALFKACKYAKLEVVKYLITEAGANVQVREDSALRMNLLHIACGLYLYMDMIEYLVSVPNIEINGRDTFGRTPLHYACMKGPLFKTAEILLKHKDINVNVKDLNHKTPLHYACETNRDKVVEWLLNAGANPTAIDQKEMTPLDYAVQKGASPELFEVLLPKSFHNIRKAHPEWVRNWAKRRMQFPILAKVFNVDIASDLLKVLIAKDPPFPKWNPYTSKWEESK